MKAPTPKPAPVTQPLPSPAEVAAALALVRRQHPAGFTVDADGLLAARPSGMVKPKSLAELLALRAEPRRLKLELAASLVEVEVFALEEKLTAEFERKAPSPIAPVKFKLENGKQVADGYNTQDPAYKEQVEEAYQCRRAMTLAAAVPLLAVEGGTPEQMRDWLLAQKLPVHFLDSLYAAAKAMSEQPQERASFI